jgi:dienelactone hydrolase
VIIRSALIEPKGQRMIEKSVAYSSDGRVFSGVLLSQGEALRPRPGVLVLHGGAGPGAHERERAERLVALGYVALIPDLFGEVFRDREHGVRVITELVASPPLLRARVGAAFECLSAQPEVVAEQVAALGFCFGGHAALELARSGKSLRAVASFHGGLSTHAPAEPEHIAGKVLVCTGAADPFVTREHRCAFEDEMTNARADWQLQIYGGAVHGFSERSERPRPGCAYDEAADRRSWTALRALLAETLAAE